MSVLWLDYESRSTVDLARHGLDRYVKDPSSQVLLAAYAFDDLTPKLWQPHLRPRIPDDLREGLESPWTEVWAWNAMFERMVTKHLLQIDKPIEEWRDPSVCARYISLPGSLEDAGKALGLSESEAKIKDGRRLIRKFCEPEAEGGSETLFGISEPTFRDWTTDPQDWSKFCDYCVQDVVSERVQARKMKRFFPPDFEWQTWFLDQRINERGIPVDLPLIAGAKAITEREMERLYKRLVDLTGLPNPNSNTQMLEFLRDKCGYSFNSLDKAFVLRAINGEGSLSDLGREALEIRKMTSKSSVKKFDAIANVVSDDARLRHQFIFYGAKKTGRWSGKEAQTQNLARPTKEVEDKMDRAIELVRTGNYEVVRQEFTQPLDVVSSVVRAAFSAPEQSQFAVADLASIETRVIGWLAKCKPLLDIYRQGKDAYKMFASKMFNKPYDEVTKDERQKAKAPILGCGFGLGGGREKEVDGDLVKTGLWGYAWAMGVQLTQEESVEYTRIYRNEYKEVVRFWYALRDAAISSIRNPGKEFEVGYLKFRCVGKSALCLLLPSGRILHYLRPLLEEREREDKPGQFTTTITYETEDQQTKVWKRVDLAGYQICENAVQAVARDFLVAGMKEADKAGFEIVLHVHDEIGAVVPVGGSLGVAQLISCMTKKPWWADDQIVLEADGYETGYYRK